MLLKQLIFQREKVKKIREKYLETRTRALKVTKNLNPIIVQTSKINSKEIQYIDMLDIEEQYKKELKKLRDLENELMSIDIPEKYKKILYLRCIKELTWMEIAEKMNYSYQWIMKLKKDMSVYIRM